MNKLRTILPLAFLAVFLIVSTSHALPSCCQGKDNGNTSGVAPFWGNVISGFRAPSAPEPAPIPSSRVTSGPGCCAANQLGAQPNPVQYCPRYGQVRQQATPGANPSYGGCCGTPVCPGRANIANLPSCRGTCGGPYTGFRGATPPPSGLPSCCSTTGGSSAAEYRSAAVPPPSSGLPPCCQVSGGSNPVYRATPSPQNARAVPAVATQRNGSGYYWNTVAGSGPFGQPGYFPTAGSR